MKTTVDLPESTFRQAKTLAADRGVTLNQFFTEALEEKVRLCASPVFGREKKTPWMAGFGALSDLSSENRRIEKLTEDEFERIELDDCATAPTPQPDRKSPTPGEPVQGGPHARGGPVMPRES